MTEPIASMNGRIVPFSAAAVPVTDLGVVAGATVTEMIRTFCHTPFRLSEHLDRLQQSLNLCDFPDDIEGADRTSLEKTVSEVVQHNAGLIPANHDLGIIIFVTAGQNLTYLGAAGHDRITEGTVCVHTFPLPFELWASKQKEGQHLATVNIKSIPNTAVPAQAKHRNRLHWFRADKQARGNFPSASALLTTSDGAITETSAGNFLIVRDRTISTPPSELVLGGISMQVVRELAANLGYEWREESLNVDQLRDADEALTSSTGYCLLPVTKLNDQLIGNGQPGPVFLELISAWSDLVGVDIVRQAAEAAQERCQ